MTKYTRKITLTVNLKQCCGYDDFSLIEKQECFICNKKFRTVKDVINHLQKNHTDKEIGEFALD